jgi:catechol 2,3-dioxygenase-like lactoylglutathione lyase family enzyme
VAGAPLPLVGRFHEFSVSTADIRACVEFYEQLGFTQATTSDAVTHPYGVLSDGRLHLGVHQCSAPSPALTFVRPDVGKSLSAFAAAGIELTTCRTGDDVFNEIAFSDPFGQAVTVLEARTYSPVARAATQVSLLGDFAEVSLPAADFAAARAFWEPLGFVAADEAQDPYPHLPLTSDTLDVAFHHPRTFDRPLLVFRSADMAARVERLRQLGVAMSDLPRGISADANALLESPDGTALLLLQGEG